MSDYKPEIHEELYDVSGAGDCARVRELLEAGADPNKYKYNGGYTALLKAAENGHNEVVKTLIQADCVLNEKDIFGNTALHNAAASGHNEVVKTLIEAECDINEKDESGNTALHRAVQNYRKDVMLSLLEGGSRCSSGGSPASPQRGCSRRRHS